MAPSKGYEQMMWALQVGASSKMGHREFRVLVALLTFRNGKTGTAWPSAARIADRAGMSTAAVERALSELRRLGVIERSATRKAQSGQSTVEYRFIGQVPSEVMEAEVPSEVMEPSPQVPSEVMEAGIQVPSEVMEPEVMEAEPGSITSVPQVPSEVMDKPVENPYYIPPTPTEVTQEEEPKWTGPAAETVALVESGAAGQNRIRPEGWNWDTVTERTLGRDLPQRRGEQAWRDAAMLAVMGWPKAEGDGDPVVRGGVAGDEPARASVWTPTREEYERAKADYPGLGEQAVARRITSAALTALASTGNPPDFAEAMKDRTGSDHRRTYRWWIAFVENHYAEFAIERPWHGN